MALGIVFILTSEILTSESNANLRFFAWHIPVGHTQFDKFTIFIGPACMG